MLIYFSPSKNAFFPKEMQKDYERTGSWPDDLIRVPYSDFVEYSLNSPPTDKCRVFKNNSFSWELLPEDNDRRISQEQSWVLTETVRIREELEKVQDYDPKAVGSVSDWRAYRKAIRVWSENLNFPNKEFRPVSPDMIKE